MSAAVCLGCLAGFSPSEQREKVSQTDRCVKAESALETQPCHLQHTTVSFPLTSSGSETSLLFNSKGRHSRIFVCLFIYFVVRMIKKKKYGHFKTFIF